MTAGDEASSTDEAEAPLEVPDGPAEPSAGAPAEPSPGPRLRRTSAADADVEAEELAELVGHDIVLDTRGSIVYIGRLTSITAIFYELEDGDVHELLDGRTSKELYVLDARQYGVKRNRKRVVVRRSEVVSLSLLADVVEY